MKLIKSDSISTQEMKKNKYQLNCYFGYEEKTLMKKKAKEKDERKNIKENQKKGKK